MYIIKLLKARIVLFLWAFMLLVLDLLTYLRPPSLLMTSWSCEALQVISGMSLPVQERTGLNVALSCTSQVSHREVLFHNSSPCVWP